MSRPPAHRQVLRPLGRYEQIEAEERALRRIVRRLADLDEDVDAEIVFVWASIVTHWPPVDAA